MLCVQPKVKKQKARNSHAQKSRPAIRTPRRNPQDQSKPKHVEICPFTPFKQMNTETDHQVAPWTQQPKQSLRRQVLNLESRSLSIRRQILLMNDVIGSRTSMFLRSWENVNLCCDSCEVRNLDSNVYCKLCLILLNRRPKYLSWASVVH